MTSTTYIDKGPEGKTSQEPFYSHALSSFIKAILDPRDPSQAIYKIFRLVNLLLLSNHIDKAHELLCAVFKNAELIVPKDSYFQLPHSILCLEYFWQTHPTLSRPENTAFRSRQGSTAEWFIAKSQWGKYRETCRTGWMLEHCKLAEPENPHIWTETDDPAILAMCCRLLAKKKEEGEYPSRELMQEALAVANKLYAQPQVPITEWTFDGSVEKRMGRHSYLLYRKLAMELAIRIGDLKRAAEILSLGLRLDGFNALNGGEVDDYLSVPGIYDVLPLIARQGKEANPFFINENDAAEMTREIIGALELRAREGRQWLLGPEKVGWVELLDRLAKGAWQVNRKEYRKLGVRCANDILFSPAREKEIEKAEKEVGELPADFKEMIRVANGFKGGWQFLNGGIAGIQEIDLSSDHDCFESFYENLKPPSDPSGTAVIQLQPGSECDSFCHYIVPHKAWKDGPREVTNEEFQYCTFAPWEGSIGRWDSVRDWVASCVEMVEAMVEKGEQNLFDSDGDDDMEEDKSSAANESEDDDKHDEETADGKYEEKSRHSDEDESEEDWVRVDVSADEEMETKLAKELI